MMSIFSCSRESLPSLVVVVVVVAVVFLFTYYYYHFNAVCNV